MTTKTLSSLIIAGVLATSAAAAVQVIEPALMPGQSGPVSVKPAASDEALFLIGVSAARGIEQRPAGIVRITR